MDNLKNVPSLLWWLLAFNALLLAGVACYYYQFDRKIWCWIERFKVVINRISVRQFGIRKSGNDAVDWLNRLQFPEEKVNSLEMELLTNLFEKSDLKKIDNVKVVDWKEFENLGVIDGTENSDNCQTKTLHTAGDTDD